MIIPKPPLVLLPGHMCDKQMWQKQEEGLSDLVSVQTIELRAHDSIEQMAQDVLDAAPPIFSLAGFSLGGYTALEIIRRSPERVARLALIDSSARPDAPENRTNRLRNIARVQSGRLTEVVDAFALSAQGPVMQRNPDLARELRMMMGRPSAEHYVAQQHALLTRQDARDVLKNIWCPTLISCGIEDSITTPEMHIEMANEIRGAVFIPIMDAGHMAPMEQPIAVTAILRYWLQMS